MNWNSGFANGGVVPDNNFSGWSDTPTVSALPTGTFTDLSVNLSLTGGWNGDHFPPKPASGGLAKIIKNP